MWGVPQQGYPNVFGKWMEETDIVKDGVSKHESAKMVYKGYLKIGRNKLSTPSCLTPDEALELLKEVENQWQEDKAARLAKHEATVHADKVAKAERAAGKEWIGPNHLVLSKELKDWYLASLTDDVSTKTN